MITIVGITNGLLLYKLISLIFNQLKTIDLQILIIVPTVTIICSLLIGVIPAIIAAKVNPAVALKSEK